MLTKIKVVAVLIIFALSGSLFASVGERPIPRSQWNRSIWEVSARSVIGEAGFGEDEEHGAIMWVYAKQYKRLRSMGKKVSFAMVVKQYSWAVKDRPDHPRPWLFQLHMGIKKKPADWPKGINWKLHRGLWRQAVELLGEWQKGNIPDLYPLATEFGGEMDIPRAKRFGLVRVVRINTDGNIFWRSK